MAWSLPDSGVAGFADGGSGHLYSFPGGTAGAGDLLIAGISSDTTVSTPSGYTIATSHVGNIGAYFFYKVATGAESSLTITTSGNNNTALAFLRYTGGTSTPLDKTAEGHSLSASNTTTPAATTATLTQAGELSVAIACLGGLQGANQINPVWSSGYTARLDGKSAALGASDQHVFAGDNQAAGTGAQSPNVTWTNSATNQTMLVATFLLAATPAGRPRILVVPGGAAHRAASW